jgi:hypothetical protein
MKTATWYATSVVLLAVPVLAACTPDATGPQGLRDATAPAALRGVARAQPIPAFGGPLFLAANGTITQTAVTGLEVRPAGPNTILEQTTVGSLGGTLSGSYEDRFTVVIHRGGRFNAHGTLTCECTVDGRQGVLVLVVTDTGEIVSPDVATFAGRLVIKSATGELAGLRGVLELEGTVDIPSGLSAMTYSGQLHFHR